MKSILNRREFLKKSAATGTGLLLLKNSRMAFGYDANSRLNIAGIGVGGQGRGSLDAFHGMGNNLVAFCDVDRKRAGDIYQKYPAAKSFEDFRVMFDRMEKQIDAVLVATPDHTHAVASVMAMKLGKHVYCEKPLTRTVHEARVMRETAAKHKVVTQMGNQGSAERRLRRAVELVWGGVIGEVREAHVWFDGGNGPMKRPTETPPVPEGLNWDLWLGPAESRPYSPVYVPAAWRSWRAFGSGIVGDFACHTANIMFRALHLERLWQRDQNPGTKKVVIRVQAWPSERDEEGYPSSSRVEMDLPARGSLPAVKLTFYAKEKPSKDLMLGHNQGGWGDLLVGSKGSIYSDNPWNAHYVLLPEKRFENFEGGPAETLPRVKSHQGEWIEACKGNGKTFSGFEIGGPLTELAQLANLACLVEGPLEYDTLSGKILNSKPASALLHRKYRKGWAL
ncbi:MAG: Gfo/Idh/MocA family oxidoreductase [Verrucomicrobiales bacterium]|nr:Gfo/Idh/MocA family oxidoreductase [Verrucomicrobiales bacterium]